MSCAVMRNLLPALATLPSSKWLTCSSSPIFWMSSFLPLNANDEVRALTCKPVIFESAVINSSLTPSLKYSSALSALMFTNGRTAIDFVAADLVLVAVAAFQFGKEIHWQVKASGPRSGVG